MEQIASFTVNHMRLLPGIYVSRKDSTGQDVVTTYDIRMTRPNFEPVMNTAEIHTIEHLGATFLRNHEEWGDRIVYFGHMGCRTGEMFEFIRNYEGEVPGAAPECCGNYLDLNLPMARYLADKYLDQVLTGITQDRLKYS